MINKKDVFLKTLKQLLSSTPDADKFKPHDKALKSWRNLGCLDVSMLVENEQIELDFDIAITQEWFLGKLQGYDALICGQITDSKPNGFVRAIDNEGFMYEGIMDKEYQRQGFGRALGASGIQSIGWFKDD